MTLCNAVNAWLRATGERAREVLWTEHQGPSVRTKSGQVVFYEEDPADSVYLLARGQLRLFVGDATKRPTGLLSAPAIFGDRDVLAGVATQETAQSISVCHLMIWERDTFLEEHATSVELRELLARDLVRRYANTMSLVRMMAMPLEDRLLRVLAELAEHGGALPPYDALAEMVGAASKSVSRTMSKLRTSEALSVADHAFAVRRQLLDDRGLVDLPPLFHSLGL